MYHTCTSTTCTYLNRKIFNLINKYSSLYRLFTFYLLFTKMSHFVSYIQYEAQFFLKNMNLEIFAHTKYWNRTSKANFVNFSLLHLLKHKKMETIWRRSTFICRILKCVKTGDIWTHCCTIPDPWFHSMYLYTHIIKFQTQSLQKNHFLSWPNPHQLLTVLDTAALWRRCWR